VPRPEPGELPEKLASFLQRHHGKPVTIENLRLLTGGASRQTWSFDANVGSESYALVLRGEARKGATGIVGEVEFRLLEAAYEAGVPVPKMHALGDDSLGMPFFLMERIEGETIARRLLRDDEYATAREVMTGQLGAALAAIHRIPIDTPGLESLPTPLAGKAPAESELAKFEQTYRAITPDPHPAFELAFRWLRRNLPPLGELRLVHGDFRIGNVIFGPDGLRAVLDWELAQIGDPLEDLAWVCVRSWRFGSDDKPVGGIGQREELWSAYEAAGGAKVDPAAARWWEVFGNLRWGIMTIMQARGFLDESVRSNLSPGAQLELAAIGRRTAETEWEILNLIEPA
jgi:aminoglycoside phosphotransferase (APT) family kinase protein